MKPRLAPHSRDSGTLPKVIFAHSPIPLLMGTAAEKPQAALSFETPCVVLGGCSWGRGGEERPRVTGMAGHMGGAHPGSSEGCWPCKVCWAEGPEDSGRGVGRQEIGGLDVKWGESRGRAGLGSSGAQVV